MKKPTMRPVRRLQVNLAENLFRDLDVLREDYEAASHSETIRKLIILGRHIRQIEQRGFTNFFAKKDDGEQIGVIMALLRHGP